MLLGGRKSPTPSGVCTHYSIHLEHYASRYDYSSIEPLHQRSGIDYRIVRIKRK